MQEFVLTRSDTAAILDAALRELLASHGIESREVYVAWGWGDDWVLDAPPTEFVAGLADLQTQIRSVSELGTITVDDLRIRRKGPRSRLANPETGVLPCIIYPWRIGVSGEGRASVQLVVWRSDKVRGWRLRFVDGQWCVDRQLQTITVCDL